MSYFGVMDIPFEDLPANHFDPPKPTIPKYGWIAPKQPADAIEGAL